MIPVINVAGMTEPPLKFVRRLLGHDTVWQVVKLLEVGIEEVLLRFLGVSGVAGLLIDPMPTAAVAYLDLPSIIYPREHLTRNGRECWSDWMKSPPAYNRMVNAIWAI
ncbi:MULTISPECIES: hypothetical protein [Rhizobium/Agrobacterium group]